MLTVERARPAVESDVRDVSSHARRASRASLHYFLTAVCGLRVEEELAVALQSLGPKRLSELARCLLLWTALQGAKLAHAACRDAVHWLFPELRDAA